MSFKRASRMQDLEYQPPVGKWDGIAPISDDVASSATGTAPSEMDRKHAAAMDRAEQIQDDVGPSLGSKEIPALYKIEVFFGPKRTHQGPNTCAIKFWESGRRLHGGGDDLMYMCKNRENLSQGCGHIFSSDFVRGSIAMCPSCKNALSAELCVRGLVYGPSNPVMTRDLAKLLAKYWRKLGCNADIYLKYDRTDIRYISMEKEFGTKKARELKGLSIYPLKHILADTAAGAELEDRFFAFLTA